MTPKGLILVVDDEENILSSLEGILHDDGYDVVTAGEGEAALKMIESEHPDLVLLDIWLPGMDGLEVLKSAKKSGMEAEFIMMSGHGSIDTAVQATKMGAFDFIEKPLSLEDVLLMVKLAMEKKHTGRAEVSGSFEGREEEFIGVSEEAINIRERLKTIWNSGGHILISGEPGTGKTFVAGILCSQIRASGRPCAWVDVASLPKRQANKIIFGGTKGSGGEGKFDQARNGTLVLEAVDQLPPGVQGKILKTLKDQEPPEGKNGKTVLPPVRLIATLSRELEGRSGQKGMNPGLLEFLGQESIQLPPLRGRPKDILALAAHFLSQKNMKVEGEARTLDKNAADVLCRHAWPGNAAELKDVMEKLSRREMSGGAVSSHDLSGQLRLEMLKSSHVARGETKAAKGAERPRVMQKTLKRSVVLCGQGLHSGIKTGLILSPLPPGSGIVFCDISTGETIQAHLDYVNSTDYATGLRKGKKVVRTIEHILAALHMYHIDNLLIKMGDEVPIMDGSAVDFCELIEDGGIEKQDRMREELVIDKKYTLDFPENNGKSISIEPAETLAVHYILDYPPPIGVQEFYFTATGEEIFKKEIAPARTFGFLRDYEKLEEMGLATGGRLSNLILLDDEKVINTALRFPDEFVRHKILDILGDFYLLGRPVKGKITAKMTGHRENISLLRKVREGLSLP